MGAAIDCETIGPGLFAQPVNSTTSLVLVAAGLYLGMRAGSRWLGIALAATGIGSFLFHGPLAPGGDWPHDVTLAWLTFMTAAHAVGWGDRFALPALATLGVLLAVVPGTADVVTVGLVVVTAVMTLRRHLGAATLLPLVLLAAAAAVGRLGSSNGPWCDPASLMQTHGVWHVGAAAAVIWWSRSPAAPSTHLPAS